MHIFLADNRDELIMRCRSKVAERPSRAATDVQLANGIPLFLSQLIRTLEAEAARNPTDSLRISGSPSGDAMDLSEIGVAATAHGKDLHALGYSVDQVVHDYGDLCQAITDLAFERGAPFSVDQFRTLNRCLDNAIADAVAEFSFQHDAALVRQRIDGSNEHLEALVHKIREALGTAVFAVGALEMGHLPVGGATGAVLRRSLKTMTDLIDRSFVAMHSYR